MEVGKTVLVDGLKAKPHLNGRTGKIVTQDGGERIGVQIDGEEQIFALRITNITLVDTPQEQADDDFTGQRVIIDGLAKKPELNGESATAVSFDSASGRYQVALASNGARLALKPCNLRKDLEAPEAGWHPATRITCEPMPADRNVERITDMREWERRFRDEFYLQKPVILTDWQNEPIAKLSKKTTRSSILRDHGERLVTVGRDWELTQGGSGQEQKKLRDHVLDLASAASSQSGGAYLFDDGSFLRGTGLDKGWLMAPCFSQLGTYYDPSIVPIQTKGALTFALGGDGQGIPFHFHADAYNLLLHGRKRWAIYGPHQMTPTGYSSTESFANWLETRQGGEGFVPPTWECVQEPGELLYIPEGFFHATVCLGECIGVVHQAISAAPSSVWSHFIAAQQSRDPASALRSIELAIAADTTNADLLMEKGVWCARMHRFDEFMDCMEAALKLNPLNGIPYKNLALGHHRLGAQSKADVKIREAVRLGIPLDGPFLPGTGFSLGLSGMDGPPSSDAEVDRRAAAWVHHLWRGAHPISENWERSLGLPPKMGGK